VTLPVQPSVETILRACVATMRDVVLPELESEWGRFSGGLLMGSLEYAIGLLDGDRAAQHRAALSAAIEGLRPLVEASATGELGDAFDSSSPFEVATRLLVFGQGNPGPVGEQVRAALHPLLFGQLDDELTAAAPLLENFAAAMRGRP